MQLRMEDSRGFLSFSKCSLSYRFGGHVDNFDLAVPHRASRILAILTIATNAVSQSRTHFCLRTARTTRITPRGSFISVQGVRNSYVAHYVLSSPLGSLERAANHLELEFKRNAEERARIQAEAELQAQGVAAPVIGSDTPVASAAAKVTTPTSSPGLSISSSAVYGAKSTAPSSRPYPPASTPAPSIRSNSPAPAANVPYSHRQRYHSHTRPAARPSTARPPSSITTYSTRASSPALDAGDPHRSMTSLMMPELSIPSSASDIAALSDQFNSLISLGGSIRSLHPLAILDITHDVSVLSSLTLEYMANHGWDASSVEILAAVFRRCLNNRSTFIEITVAAGMEPGPAAFLFLLNTLHFSR